MFSNSFLRVSIRAGKSSQFQCIGLAKSNFKRYLSIPSVASFPKHDSSRAKTEGRPSQMRESVESGNYNMLTNGSSTVKVKDASNFSNDSDVFGSLSKSFSGTADELDTDEGDRREEEYLENKVPASQKLTTKQYADIIKAHLNSNNLKAAIDVLQVRMIKEDQVKPENYIYNLLIGACGRTGHAKQAFHLYNQMKKRSLAVTGGTYTALFNACANTVYPEDGLKRANHLREIMTRKCYQPNATNYHAMIKAYGRCGDLKTAFALADQMIADRHVPTAETYNFLLHACVGDHEAGFRHALLVWRKMREHRVRPDTYTYNLVLRAVRDCGLGHKDAAEDVIQRIVGSQKLLMADAVSDAVEDNTHHIASSRKLLSNNLKSEGSESSEPASHETRIEHIGSTSTTEMQSLSGSIDVGLTENWPDLLSPTPHLGDSVRISECVTAQHRLLMLGGCSAFLGHMARDSARPNIKTFSQLMDCVPGTIAAEKALLGLLKSHGIRPDTGLYNNLIKKRSMRSDHSGARQVLQLMSQTRLTPDLITFGVLALGCKTEEQAVQLLGEMDAAGFSVNIEILGAMLKNACIAWNFGYVLEMMETARRNNLRPNAQFYQHLHTFHKTGRKMIHDKDHGAAGIDFVDGDYFRKGYRLFCARYQNWLREMERANRDGGHVERDNKDVQ